MGLVTLNTICLFFYRQLDYVANQLHRPPLLTFAEEAVGGLAGLAVFPLIYQTAIRFPLLSAKWRVYLPVHLLAVCLISIVHTSLIAVFRMLFFPPLGFGDESYGYMPARYPMEFSHLFIYYWIIVSLIYFIHEVRFTRQRELLQAKLESNLAEAQLQNLRLQLEPHFLFNVLNAISAAIYEDPRTADEMVGRLSELLRHLLKESPSQLVSLARELEILQLYTRLMQARLEDRLNVSIKVTEDVTAALLPQLILQPIVENAIRHGLNPRFEARIEIEASSVIEDAGKSLRLMIRDFGPGLDPSQELVMGIGLRNTTARLRHLYGQQHQFSIRNAPDAGVVVEIILPFLVSSEPDEGVALARSLLVAQDALP